MSIGSNTLAHELRSQAAWLKRLARSLVGEGAADDLVQDTLETALRSAPDASRPLRPWLASVLRNTARMHWRSSSRRRQREQLAPHIPHEIEPPNATLAKMQMHRELADAVLDLPVPYRETITLRFVEDLSAADIARKLEVPAGTVRSRLKRGLDMLRMELDRRSDGNRERWRAALLPLLIPAKASVPTTGALTTGAFTMKIVIGTAIIATTVAATVAAWPSDSRPNHSTKVVAPSTSPAAGNSSSASATNEAASKPPSQSTMRRFSSKDERERFAQAIARARQQQQQQQQQQPQPEVQVYSFAGDALSGDHPGPQQRKPLSGKLDHIYIRDRISDIKPLLAECYELARVEVPSLSGHLAIDFTIDAEEDVGGYVREASISEQLEDEEAPIENKALSECVIQTILSLEFAPPAGGGEVRVRYPFHFGDSKPPE